MLKHVRVDDMVRVLSVFPATIRGTERSLKALSVSAAPAVVAAIEETVKRLDVPQPPAKSVDITGYVLDCSAQPTGESRTPKELEPVVAQLERTFGYGGCGLAQTLLVRGHDDAHFSSFAGELRSSPKGEDARPLHERSLEADLTIDSAQSPTLIRLRHLRYYAPGTNSSFSGDVDLRDGQQVILGKVGSGDNRSDQILLLTGRVVD